MFHLSCFKLKLKSIIKLMQNLLNKYGGFNSYDLLKAIAIITMVIDHAGLFFFPDIALLRIIGRMSFPLFAFCLGYNRKYNIDSTLLVLASIMCLSHFVFWPDLQFMIKGSILKASILPSIIIIRFSMNYIERFLTSKNMFILVFILWFFALQSCYLFQYGSTGIIMAICGYLCATLKNRQEYKVFLYINLILYLCFEAILFRANLENFSILIFEFFIIAKLLKNFSIQSIAIAKIPGNILLILSRYAMMIYFIHSEIFKLLSILL